MTTATAPDLLAMNVLTDSPPRSGVDVASSGWSYEEAFCRNLGLINEEEQQELRNSRVAIAGMGGVGGIHLITLARLGIGRFTIADGDVFELANMNRQYGCRMDTLGGNKAVVMAEEARRVNPELDLRVIDKPISRANAAEFLTGADLFVDGLDFFAIDARRSIFHDARRRGLWAITAGPHAFGTSWLLFGPQGMPFDEYFDFQDSMSDLDKVIAFAVGTVPAAIHLSYLNLAECFRPMSSGAASVGFACHLASGIVGVEALRVLLDRSGLRAAPWYSQFDAYRQKLVQRRLRWGNRHPVQRLRRWWLRRKLTLTKK